MGKIIPILILLVASAAVGFDRHPVYQRLRLTGGVFSYDIHQIRPGLFENGAPIDTSFTWVDDPSEKMGPSAWTDNQRRALELLQGVEAFEESVALNMQYIAPSEANLSNRPPPNPNRTVTWISPVDRPEQVLAMLSVDFRPTLIHQILRENRQPPIPVSPPDWQDAPDLEFENPGATGRRFFTRETGLWWDTRKVGRRWVTGASAEVQSYFMDAANEDDFSLLLNQLTIPEARFGLDEIPGGAHTSRLDPEKVALIWTNEGKEAAIHAIAPWVVPFQRIDKLIAWTVLPALDRQYQNLYRFTRHCRFKDERFLVRDEAGKVIRDGTVSVFTTPSSNFEFTTWESLRKRRERARSLVNKGNLVLVNAGQIEKRGYRAKFTPVTEVFANRYLDTLRPNLTELSNRARLADCLKLTRQHGAERGVEIYLSRFE